MHFIKHSIILSTSVVHVSPNETRTPLRCALHWVLCRWHKTRDCAVQLQMEQLSAVWDHRQAWVELAGGLLFCENLPHLKIIVRSHTQGGFHVISFLQFVVLEVVLKLRNELGAPWQCLDPSIYAKGKMGSQLSWN